LLTTLRTSLVRFLLRVTAALPLRGARALGRSLGGLAWLSGSRARAVTERNIALAYPQLTAADRRRLARRSLLATGELAAEAGWVWHRPWEQVSAVIREVRGADAVAGARAAGHGALILAPHLGNWEVLGLHLATFGDSVALYEPPQLRALDALVRAARERTGSTLVPTDSRGLALLLRCLRRGGVVGVLPDQVPPRQASGENSEFMGVPCFTATLPGRLLQRVDARAFFAFAERIAGGFRLHYLPAPEELYSRDMSDSLRALNRGVEACLRYCPEQYQWEYKRFRTRPRGEQDHYAGV
jgi:KDO2-lipid IV(A) lauroyltransferase